MRILFTVAAFSQPNLPKSLFDQTMALPYHLYVISTQVPGMPLSRQYGTALVLLMITLTLTLMATIDVRAFAAGGTGDHATDYLAPKRLLYVCRRNRGAAQHLG